MLIDLMLIRYFTTGGHPLCLQKSLFYIQCFFVNYEHQMEVKTNVVYLLCRGGLSLGHFNPKGQQLHHLAINLSIHVHFKCAYKQSKEILYKASLIYFILYNHNYLVIKIKISTIFDDSFFIIYKMYFERICFFKTITCHQYHNILYEKIG